MKSSMDAKLRELTGYRLRRATSAALPEINRILAPFGLRRTTFSALTVIGEHPGLNQSQLAKALSIERPNLVQMIDELERANKVQRLPIPNDRRTYALKATSAGMELQKRADEALREYEDALTTGMSRSEIETLHRLLGMVEENAVISIRAREERSDEIEISSA